MQDAIIKRIVEMIALGASGKILSIGDYDEMKLLHNRVHSSFPREFNDLFTGLGFSSSPFSTAPNDNREVFQRLLRILEVVEKLPMQLRIVPSDGTKSDEALVPLFELSNKDKARVFELCSDMQKIVFVSLEFDQPHRLRILNRIAAIIAETQKPKGMFDIVRGGINDLGETLGKFGVDIKPLTDRMREVVGIARKGTKEYDQLPAPDEVKRLPAPSAEESADS